VDGRAGFEGAAFIGSSAAASFVASEDGTSLESAVFEGAAKVVFKGDEATGERGGEIGADRIAVGFGRDPFDLVLAKTSDRSSLSFRSAAGRAVTVHAQTTLLNFFRDPDSVTWAAAGGVRAEITDAHGPGRALEGEEAVFDGARVLHMYGRAGQAAVADSVEARIEAPQIHVATASEGLLASGGVAGVLKDDEGRRKAGFFSPGEDVVFSCRQLELRPEISVSLFTANVLLSQGTDTLRAYEIELAGDQGRMSGAGGVAITLTEAAEGRAGLRTIDLGGEEMAYRPDLGTLTLTTKAYVRLPEAGLVAERVSAVMGRGGQSLESLTAAGGVAVSRGEYVGRSEAAAYQAASDRLTLTGSPVLTDGKGGSARGVKLTFDLADDKILLENEGPGRSTTIIRS
jgi:lipopolysaccharide export system protein LptA